MRCWRCHDWSSCNRRSGCWDGRDRSCNRWGRQCRLSCGRRCHRRYCDSRSGGWDGRGRSCNRKGRRNRRRRLSWRRGRNRCVCNRRRRHSWSFQGRAHRSSYVPPVPTLADLSDQAGLVPNPRIVDEYEVFIGFVYREALAHSTGPFSASVLNASALVGDEHTRHFEAGRVRHAVTQEESTLDRILF